jgi:bromodomain and PHD finger-containing protein 1
LKSYRTPTIAPNTSITLETPRFDTKIPDSFRLYRGQGSNSENSENSDFSDSCTSCEFSESYTNSEYGSSGDDDVSDSEMNSDNNSDSVSLNRVGIDEDSQATTTTRTSEKKDSESRQSNDSDDEIVENSNSNAGFNPLQLVWAKSRGYPWYPALIIDPNIKKGFMHNSVPLPCPPDNVLTMRKNTTEDQYLILFFDTKRTWQWLTQSKLELLGLSKSVDESKLTESKKPALRKAVKKAYEEALHYQSQVTKRKPEGKL